MGRYHVELPGKLSLKQQSKAIEGEEALAARFIGLRLWVNAKNEMTNLVEFEEIDTEPDPPLGTPRLATALGDGESPEWAGPLIAQGKAIAQAFLVRDAD